MFKSTLLLLYQAVVAVVIMMILANGSQAQSSTDGDNVIWSCAGLDKVRQCPSAQGCLSLLIQSKLNCCCSVRKTCSSGCFLIESDTNSKCYCPNSRRNPDVPELSPEPDPPEGVLIPLPTR